MGEEPTGVMEPPRAMTVDDEASLATNGSLESRGENPDEEKHADESSPTQEVDTIRAEIDEIRDDLGDYISELDRRRHEAFDLKFQLRKHRDALIGIGVGLVALTVGASLLRRRAARARSVTARVEDMHITMKKAAIGIAGAAATALVSALVKKVMTEKESQKHLSELRPL